MAAVGIGDAPRRGFEAALRLALGVAAALHLAHRHRARRAGALLRALVRRLSMAPQLAREVERRGGVVIALYRGRGTGEERSEEHTSELQSLMRSSYAVFCLKKKNTPQDRARKTKSPHYQQHANKHTKI